MDSIPLQSNILKDFSILVQCMRSGLRYSNSVLDHMLMLSSYNHQSSTRHLHHLQERIVHHTSSVPKYYKISSSRRRMRCLGLCHHFFSVRVVNTWDDGAFAVTGPPIFIVKNAISRRCARYIPTNWAKYFMISRLHDEHPNGFLPHFNGVYKNSSPCTSRQSNIVLHVAQKHSRFLLTGTKMPFRSTKINTILMCDILDIFTPQDGIVTDWSRDRWKEGWIT